MRLSIRFPITYKTEISTILTVKDSVTNQTKQIGLRFDPQGTAGGSSATSGTSGGVFTITNFIVAMIVIVSCGFLVHWFFGSREPRYADPEDPGRAGYFRNYSYTQGYRPHYKNN